MAYFKRIWRLKIQINNSIKTYQELDYEDTSLRIDFNVENSVNGAFANGDITLYNLSFEDMQYLASSVSPFGKFKRNKISLEVGYRGSLGLILGGNIMEVQCDFNNVDNRINLKVMGGLGNNLANNSVQTSYKGDINFKDICKDCAKKNNLGLFFDNKINNRFLNNFSFLGTPFQMIQRLRSYFDDINIFISETGKILNITLKEEGQIINKQELSYKTGLIGRVKPTMLGCEVSCLLNINLKVGSFIKLKNEKLKDYDGLYVIYQLKHVGSNYGEAWLTNLSMRRVKNG